MTSMLFSFFVVIFRRSVQTDAADARAAGAAWSAARLFAVSSTPLLGSAGWSTGWSGADRRAARSRRTGDAGGAATRIVPGALALPTRGT